MKLLFTTLLGVQIGLTGIAYSLEGSGIGILTGFGLGIVLMLLLAVIFDDRKTQ